MENTKEQLEMEILLMKKLESERQRNDQLYAIKRIELIVYGIMSIIGMAVLNQILKQVMTQ